MNITIDYSHHITFFMRTAIGQDRRMYVVFSTRDPVWCRPHAPDAAHTAAPGGGQLHTAYTQYPSPLSDTPEGGSADTASLIELAQLHGL